MVILTLCCLDQDEICGNTGMLNQISPHFSKPAYETFEGIRLSLVNIMPWQ
jgi:hypothetical protein